MKEKFQHALCLAIKAYRIAQGEFTMRGGTIILAPTTDERVNIDEACIESLISYHCNSFHAEKPKLSGHLFDAYQSIDKELGQNKSINLKYEIKGSDYNYTPTLNGEFVFMIDKIDFFVDTTHLYR